MSSNVILYTKKYELKFDKKGVSLIDISDLIEDLSKDYVLLDRNPTVTVSENFQYVTLKVSKKGDRQKIGF
jgi:hypothetical protein